MKTAIIYRGPSKLDGAPIIVVATGLAADSRNAKTGAMIQTWILRADISPTDAVHTGQDASICGGCPHRGIIENGRNVNRSCYVLEFQAPASIYRSAARGNVPTVDSPAAIAELGRDRNVRLGSYGDPAAVPAYMWRALTRYARMHAGYTHQCRSGAHNHLRDLVMASCDSERDRTDAAARGWRTFRVRARDAAIMPREAVCPASAEAGHKITCADCGACSGVTGRRTSGITIIAHGSSARAKYARALVAA